MSDARHMIAIAGNPNSGKTTIFNALTGARQRVGNYPGVTVEKKEGVMTHEGIAFDVVDLPGTYSLSASSIDERIARDYIIKEHPDVVINVIDSTNFERHAYLTSQLVELGVKMIVVLNMSDQARANGQIIDAKMIGERLGCEVVETVGHKGIGIRNLKEAIIRSLGREHRKIALDYGEELGQAIGGLEGIIQFFGTDRMKPYPDRWIAVKLLESDPDARALVLRAHAGDSAKIFEKVGGICSGIEGHHGDRLDALIAERRYGFATGLYREVVREDMREVHRGSEFIDDILMHRLFGIPIFIAIMYAIFYVTFAVGEIPMGWIEGGFARLSDLLSSHWTDGALKSLVVDGAIGGVGGVITFLPSIVLLFMGISVLEDSGYMARVAFIMDKLMHKIGLHGKSFIPMMIGFGCSVPAIMATRTLENRRDRLATMLVIPLMSCGARLPIYALIIPAFFPAEWRPKIMLGIYLVGILLAVGLIRLLRSTLLKGDSMPFVMELPPYRMPTAKGIAIHMWERSRLYLKKAGTIILAISIVMWFLTSYPKAPEGEPALSHSIAGKIGMAVEPVFKPLGFDWRINTSLIGAFGAKEVFVSQLGIIFSIDDASEESTPLRAKIREHYTPLAGICVMLFCLIAAPCMATLAITRRESGHIGYALLQFFGLTAIAYMITLAVYQFGILFGWGT